MTSSSNRPQLLAPWSRQDIPDLAGKIAFVVGGTSGVGLETVKGLVDAGAEVFIFITNNQKGEEDMRKVQILIQSVKVFFLKGNLGSLVSISELAKNFNLLDQALDILVYNVNVTSRSRRNTTDGFESIMGINYLALFALTAQLLPALKKSSSPRMVVVTNTISSNPARVDFNDFHGEQSKYKVRVRETQTNLAKLLFSIELQRKSMANGWGINASTVNDGVVRQSLASTKGNIFLKVIRWGIALIVGHNPPAGADYVLFCATSPTAKGGEYYGPSNLIETKGPLARLVVPDAAMDRTAAEKLWEVSMEMTKVSWE